MAGEGVLAAGHLQGDPAHEKVAGENGKKSDEELGEQVGASFEKLTGKEKKVVRPPRNPVTRNAEARGEGKC